MLGYGAFDTVPSAAFLRAPNPTYTRREVGADRQRRGNMGVGCVKTSALTWQTISKPWCVERNTSNLSRRRRDLFPPDNAK